MINDFILPDEFFNINPLETNQNQDEPLIENLNPISIEQEGFAYDRETKQIIYYSSIIKNTYIGGPLLLYFFELDFGEQPMEYDGEELILIEKNNPIVKDIEEMKMKITSSYNIFDKEIAEKFLGGLK